MIIKSGLKQNFTLSSDSKYAVRVIVYLFL